MKPIQVIILGMLAGLVFGVGCASTAPPAGFQWIPQWGVYASPDDIFWHAGVQWRLQDGTWLRLEAGHWVADPYPPAVIVAIPPGQAHCPPGLAKKGCVPPGLQKKGGVPPGQHKKGN
ncbi:MAG TPA: hypothetical protein VNP04_12465 [Alphaproteobacteria bacterium]|nr:hypothetical protein [Alphaproteobacteria bacterium]